MPMDGTPVLLQLDKAMELGWDENESIEGRRGSEDSSELPIQPMAVACWSVRPGREAELRTILRQVTARAHR